MKIGDHVTNISRHDDTPDRLSRLADHMNSALVSHPEYGPDVKAIILLDTEDQGCVGMQGYGGIDSDDNEAFANLMMHVAAMLKANGMSMELIAVPDSPEGIDDDP